MTRCWIPEVDRSLGRALTSVLSSRTPLTVTRELDNDMYMITLCFFSLFAEMAFTPWTIKQMRPEHFDEAWELMIDIFDTQEPIGKALGFTRADVCEGHSKSEMQRFLKYQLSVVAVTQTNEIIGVRFMDGEFSLPTATDGPPRMKPLFALFGRLVSCIDWNEFQSDPSNNLSFGGPVAVKETRKGEGIGKALMMESLRLAKKSGYKFHFLNLTSKYSLKIALKLGFELKAFIKYKDFEYNGGKPFLNMNPEHDGVGLAVIDLDQLQE